jgi:hypothetical protein
MRASNDCINVNDFGDLLIIDIVVSFDDPRSRIFVGLITHAREPVNERTAVFGTVVLKGEENADLCDVKASHAWLVRVGFDQNGIVSRSPFVPGWRGMNAFTPHTLDTAYVAGRIELGDG